MGKPSHVFSVCHALFEAQKGRPIFRIALGNPRFDVAAMEQVHLPFRVAMMVDPAFRAPLDKVGRIIPALVPIQKEGLGHGSDEFADQSLDGDAFGFGFVVADDAVAQDRQGHGAHVFDVWAVLAGEGGVALRSHDEVLRSARTGTPAEVLVDLIGGVLTSRAGLGGQLDGVFDHVVGHRHFTDVLLEGGDFVAGEHGVDGG